MDEMAEKFSIDPVEFRILNDTQVDPENPKRPFSQRGYRMPADRRPKRFGWERRSSAQAKARDGRWLIGTGVAAAFRNSLVTKSAARVRLGKRGIVTVETDMTDIGTGSYRSSLQTAPK